MRGSGKAHSGYSSLLVSPGYPWYNRVQKKERLGALASPRHERGDGQVPGAYILERYPDARDDYKMMMARYCLSFDSLADILDQPELCARFLAWFQASATSPKTLQNRCMEIQSHRPDLDARPKRVHEIVVRFCKP